MKATHRLDGSYKNTPGGLFVPYRKSINDEAKKSSAVAGEAEDVNTILGKEFSPSETRQLWYSLYISVGVVLFLVLFIRMKWIKL